MSVISATWEAVAGGLPEQLSEILSQNKTEKPGWECGSVVEVACLACAWPWVQSPGFMDSNVPLRREMLMVGEGIWGRGCKGKKSLYLPINSFSVCVCVCIQYWDLNPVLTP
jgi:hypothetical protein